jgi:hypothetical protein
MKVDEKERERLGVDLTADGERVGQRPSRRPAVSRRWKRRIACSCNILTRMRRLSAAFDAARLRARIRGGSLNEDQWFRENEKELLETARIAREKREADRATREQVAVREALKKAHFMKCPKCGHDMKEEVLDVDVTIDRCSYCEGVYFDAGELERAYMKKAEERRGLFRQLLRI